MKLKFYSDPGHGWLAVKRTLLNELGVEDKISPYSYQKGKTVYLEEDCDLSVLSTALSIRGIVIEYDERHTDKRSPIRSYDSYTA